MAQVVFFEAVSDIVHQPGVQPATVEAGQTPMKRVCARNAHQPRVLEDRHTEADMTHFQYLFVDDHASIDQGRRLQESSHFILHVSDVHATKSDELKPVSERKLLLGVQCPELFVDPVPAHMIQDVAKGPDNRQNSLRRPC